MLTILYVDDEPDLLELGKIYLERNGEFLVDITTSASAAIIHLQSKKYDAVIADYQMPEMDGIQLLKHIRRHEQRGIPFILFTGKGREEIVIQALNEGADFYLQKGGEPVSQFAELAHHVRQAVQRSRAEESIRDYERREADILNFLPDATFAIDTKGIVIAWNHAMEKMTGVPASCILGKGNYEQMIPFFRQRSPILIDLVFARRDEIQEKYPGVRIDGEVLTAETFSADLNGRNAVLWGMAVPLHDTHGVVIGAIESIRDITDRRMVEDALKNREERYRLLLQNVNDGTIVYHLSREGPGRILEVNDRICQILGYPPEELLQMAVTDLDVPEQRVNHAAVAGRIFSTTHAVFETEYGKKDGERIPVEISARLFDLEGEPTVLAVIRDITERKVLESEMEYYTAELTRHTSALQHVNEKLNLMNRVTRHDILNQLTAILGYLEMTKMKLPDDPVLQKYVGAEIQAAQNIQTQIMFTKDYQDIGVHSPHWFDLRSVIRSAAESLPLQQFTLSVNIDDIGIYADPLIEKVFYTLLENTIRHGKTVTDIRFTSRELEDGFQVIYEDNGVGVPAEHKEDILQQRYFKHTGFGLFLSVTILNITGITLRETGEQGRGARFEITIPAGVYRGNRVPG